MKKYNKIIGIGMPKTGTTSLATFLNQNSFKCLNNSHECILNGLNVEHLNKYDAFNSSPFILDYPKMDKLFPNSKFILTTRSNIDSWNASIKILLDHAFRTNKWVNATKSFHKRLFNQLPYDKYIMTKSYTNHLYNVVQYFKQRPNDLLILDLYDNNKITNICNFLNIETHIDYPWVNKRSVYNKN